MVINFCGFVRSTNFLTVDDCNMDERLVFNLLPGIRRASQGSLAVVVDWTFTSGSVDLRASLFRASPCNFIFCVLNFRGWFRLQNFSNSKIFPIYGNPVNKKVPVKFLRGFSGTDWF